MSSNATTKKPRAKALLPKRGINAGRLPAQVLQKEVGKSGVSPTYSMLHLLGNEYFTILNNQSLSNLRPSVAANGAMN
jgi:hypothetical protein